jgi:hypothetical protein
MRHFSLDPTVQRDLADFLEELGRVQARYVVVGGWAVMAHTGHPRPTKDIDVYVAPEDPNLLRVAGALAAFGAPAHLCAVEALRPNPDARFSGLHFGLPPNRIDILSKMGVDFEEVEMRLEHFDMRGSPIPVASSLDLITLKRLAIKDDPSRKTDRADLQMLEALRDRPVRGR